MALHCAAAFPAMEVTNGNYGRPGSHGAFGSGVMEPEIFDGHCRKYSFFNGMEEVIRQLTSLDETCTDIIQKFNLPEGPGTSQSDVSQCSIENTATKDPSGATGVDQSMEKMKFLPPVQGQDEIIDLTSEDSCDSQSSEVPDQEPVDQEPVDAGQVLLSPLGTSMATGITILSDSDDDDGDDDGYGKNVNGSLWCNSGVAKADGSDPLAHDWETLRRAIEAVEGPVKEPPTLIPGLTKDSSFKRRKANNGDVLSQNVSIEFQWPVAEETTELLQVVEPNCVSRPKRGRGRPRKEAPSQIECRDLLEDMIEKPSNNGWTAGQGFVDVQIELQEDKFDKAMQVAKTGKGENAGKGGNGGKEDKVEKKAKRDGRKENQSDKKGREKRQNPEEFLEDEFDEEDEELGKTVGTDLTGELLKLTSKLKGEKVDYEPYVNRRHEEEVEGDELEELFDGMKAMGITSGRTADMMTNQNREKECDHSNFDFDDNTGYYCPDCGTIGLEMPTSQSSCNHRNREMSDDAGIFCLDCGKVLKEIQSYFVAGDMLKASKKQTKKMQEKEYESPLVQLDLLASRGSEDFCGVDFQLHPSFQEKMHPHQKRGFNFLAKQLLGGQQPSEQMGCILAHAPGTGKTCLVISFIQSFLAKFPEGKPLILAPKIMLQSWENEFETWKVQEVPIYRIGGSGGTSTGHGDGGYEDDDDEDDTKLPPHVNATVKEGRAMKLKEWQAGRGVLLMSYKLFSIMVTSGLADVPTESLEYQMSKVLLETTNLVILDEGHLARNKGTQISQALLAMDTKRKVLLSGTLFQNTFKELYTLLKLCRDDFMLSHPLYQRRIAEIAAYSNGPKYGNGVSSLQKKSMKDIMLIEEKIFTEEIGEKLERYVKSGEDRTDEIEPVVLKLQSLTQFVDWYRGDILKTLPGLYEYTLYLHLTEFQEQTIARISPTANHMSRQCLLSYACIHPSLVSQAEDSLPEFRVSAPPSESEAYKGVKIFFIQQLLAHCMLKKEKLLIFCSTLSPLGYIEKFFCDYWTWQSGKQVLTLNGEMQEPDRQRVILQFNDMNSKSHVLLASTKACKEGISLVGASRVVILDCPDNPAVVRQAVSRAFRIGQKKKVYVYRLVAEQKDEQLIFHRSVNKERLSQVLLDPVSTMARMQGFLQDVQSPADIEDEILRKIMQDDKANGGQIQEIKIYNALG